MCMHDLLQYERHGEGFVEHLDPSPLSEYLLGHAAVSSSIQPRDSRVYRAKHCHLVFPSAIYNLKYNLALLGTLLATFQELPKRRN